MTTEARLITSLPRTALTVLASAAAIRRICSSAFLASLSPGVARAFVEDMRLFFAESDLVKRDEIAARQLHVLRQYYTGRLRLFDAIEMFLRMKDFV
jgi:hypothetical protein